MAPPPDAPPPDAPSPDAPSRDAPSRADGQGNLLAALPGALDAERIEVLAQRGGARVERIVSTGQSSPDGFWYDQDHDEWVTVVSGAAVLEIEGEGAVELGPGDWRMLPARQRHRVAATSLEEPTVWLAMHLPRA